MHRQNENFRIRTVLQNLPCRLKTIHRGHAEIHYRQIGLEFPRLFYRLSSIGRFGCDLKTRLLFDQRTQTPSDNFMVICHQHADSFHRSPPKKVTYRRDRIHDTSVFVIGSI